MNINDKIQKAEAVLTNDKLDKSEMLNALANIMLDSPPASFTLEDAIEEKQTETLNYAVSICSLKPCLYHYIYIWECNGSSYWAFLLKVDGVSVSGFKWTGREWIYFRLYISRIDSFVCYR